MTPEHLAKEAARLLADDVLKEALSSLRFESLERLSTCDPTDADTIRLHQAYIRVVDDLPLQLERYILAIRRDDMPAPV